MPRSLFIKNDAGFSPCRTWRYWLTREWNDKLAMLAWVLLNPSKADEFDDDRTIGRCTAFAADWGYGGIYVVNAFAFCTTYPVEMKAAADPVGPDNDAEIRKAVTGRRVIAAWGNDGAFLNRHLQLIDLLNRERAEVYCLGTTQEAHPRHPLYVKGSTALIPYCGRFSE